MFGAGDTRGPVARRVTKIHSGATAPHGGADLPAMSSDELSTILERCGARIVAHTDHGVLFAAQRRLILVRRAAVVAANDMGDVVRCASLAPAKLRVMLAEVRAAARSPQQRKPVEVPIDT
jgi:hypothetical protein